MTTTQHTDYDLAIVGGGLAGSSLATVMARQGARVLVLERETAFRDRVRGEWLAPWGVAEARRLGLLDIFDRAGGHELGSNISRSGKPRPLRSPEGDPAVAFEHPRLQEAMITAAAEHSAEVIRGVSVQAIVPGQVPAVRYKAGDGAVEARARMVIGADGRSSLSRKALGRPEEEHRGERLLAGVRVGNLRGDEDSSWFLIQPQGGTLACVYPQGNGHGRAYVFLRENEGRLTGPEGFRRFVEVSIASGIPAEVIGDATQEGPLAAFMAADSWVERPYRDGLALVGDAAGISDPTWGMGIALAMRDAATLSSALLSSSDWDAAATEWSTERDRYFAAIRTVENWQTELLLSLGDEANERRLHAARRWSQDPSRVPDLPGRGPELDTSEEARKRFFGEDDDVAVWPAPSSEQGGDRQGEPARRELAEVAG